MVRPLQIGGSEKEPYERYSRECEEYNQQETGHEHPPVLKNDSRVTHPIQATRTLYTGAGRVGQQSACWYREKSGPYFLTVIFSDRVVRRRGDLPGSRSRMPSGPRLF